MDVAPQRGRCRSRGQPLSLRMRAAQAWRNPDFPGWRAVTHAIVGRMRAAFCAVAVLALACLLLRSARVGLAGDYVDPISKVKAQDESLYAHSAIRMATQGGWLTPLFMGRYALYKPPLLIWAAALPARIFGVSRLALRLPVALMCSMAVGLVFLWAAELRSWQAGASAALLMISNHLWHVLGGMSMTDGLLV